MVNADTCQFEGFRSPGLDFMCEKCVFFYSCKNSCPFNYCPFFLHRCIPFWAAPEFSLRYDEPASGCWSSQSGRSAVSSQTRWVCFDDGDMLKLLWRASAGTCRRSSQLTWKSTFSVKYWWGSTLFQFTLTLVVGASWRDADRLWFYSQQVPTSAGGWWDRRQKSTKQ